MSLAMDPSQSRTRPSLAPTPLAARLISPSLSASPVIQLPQQQRSPRPMYLLETSPPLHLGNLRLEQA